MDPSESAILLRNTDPAENSLDSEEFEDILIPTNWKMEGK